MVQPTQGKGPITITLKDGNKSHSPGEVEDLRATLTCLIQTAGWHGDFSVAPTNVRIKASNPVQGLSVESPQASTIPIMWLPPGTGNGNRYKYSLGVSPNLANDLCASLRQYCNPTFTIPDPETDRIVSDNDYLRRPANGADRGPTPAAAHAQNGKSSDTVLLSADAERQLLDEMVSADQPATTSKREGGSARSVEQSVKMSVPERPVLHYTENPAWISRVIAEMRKKGQGGLVAREKVIDTLIAHTHFEKRFDAGKIILKLRHMGYIHDFGDPNSYRISETSESVTKKRQVKMSARRVTKRVRSNDEADPTPKARTKGEMVVEWLAEESVLRAFCEQMGRSARHTAFMTKLIRSLNPQASGNWSVQRIGWVLRHLVEAKILFRPTPHHVQLHPNLERRYLSVADDIEVEADTEEAKVVSTTQPTPPVPASATESREPPESDDDDEIYELMAEMAQKIKTLEEEIERRPTAGDLATLQARNAELEAELANRPSKKDVAREMAMKALGKST